MFAEGRLHHEAILVSCVSRAFRTRPNFCRHGDGAATRIFRGYHREQDGAKVEVEVRQRGRFLSAVVPRQASGVWILTKRPWPGLEAVHTRGTESPTGRFGGRGATTGSGERGHTVFAWVKRNNCPKY